MLALVLVLGLLFCQNAGNFHLLLVWLRDEFLIKAAMLPAFKVLATIGVEAVKVISLVFLFAKNPAHIYLLLSVFGFLFCQNAANFHLL